MTSFYQGLWRRLATCALSLATAGFAASCQQLGDPQPSVGSLGGSTSSAAPAVAVTQQAQVSEEACGFPSCSADLLAKGTASISGVPAVDAFFQAVLDFNTKSSGISADIDAQLAAIRADFDIEADADLAAALKAKISAQGTLSVKAEPPRCAVDAQATLEAQAKCDVSVDPGKATVECKGSCEVEASADVKCDANADLQCTVVAPSIMCDGSCKGSCDVAITGSAKCEGTCSGSCSGTCSAYVKNAQGDAQCAGTCDGMCSGSCKSDLAVAAQCSGKCEGECTKTNPSGGCTGGIRAECKAKANLAASCSGRCTGDFEPPSASAECEANARAQAKLNVECTPPRLAVVFVPKIAVVVGADLTARLRFLAAIKNLEVRLPALLASVERAKSMGEAYGELTGAGKTAIEAAAGADAKGNLRVQFGLLCAAKQLGGVANVLKDSNTQLTASLAAAAKLKSGLSL